MPLRPALLATAALATALGSCIAFTRWGAGGNHDLSGLARVFQHGEELERHRQAGRRRAEARRALAAEVVAGRMSLREAAGHLRRLQEADPAHPPGIPPPAGDEPGLYEWVLDAVWEVL